MSLTPIPSFFLINFHLIQYRHNDDISLSNKKITYVATEYQQIFQPLLFGY